MIRLSSRHSAWTARALLSACLGFSSIGAMGKTAPAASAGAAAGGSATLQKVATFQHQVTGVAVTENGRIFVNFPRWSEDAPISLAEVGKDGKLTPYPDQEWNGYRNAAPLSPGDHWVCVQAETADGHGGLWVIDPAAPNTEFIVPGGPKLVKIDLAHQQGGADLCVRNRRGASRELS